jgi:dTDP-4-dehydrorhamnose reductase
MARVLVAGPGPLAQAVSAAVARDGHERRTAPPAIEACSALVRAWRPDVIVDSRLDPPAATAATLGRLAADVDAMTILVSLADVFDGGGPYVESDEPAPATRAGIARLRMEGDVRRVNPRHAIVRASWPIGLAHDDKVGALLEGGIAAERIAVDDRAAASPTYIPHLAAALAELVRRPAFGILHVTAAGRCTELELARYIFEVAEVASTPVPAVLAPEPALASRRADVPQLPHWRTGVGAWTRELIGRPEPARTKRAPRAVIGLGAGI